MSNTLGGRIAALRGRAGYTQQELADRLAISRTAVSHIEAGISVPSERTVTLLAGLFKIEPNELIAETSYPAAKAERLPLVACRYTEGELLARLVQRDCEWLLRLCGQTNWFSLVQEICHEWFTHLDELVPDDPRERAVLAAARAELERVRGTIGDEGRRTKDEGQRTKERV